MFQYHAQVRPKGVERFGRKSMIHAWHDCSSGDRLPHEFNAVIEIPEGSNVTGN